MGLKIERQRQTRIALKRLISALDQLRGEVHKIEVLLITSTLNQEKNEKV